MNSGPIQPELAEPYLLSVLSSAGLDIEYSRAEGNTLYSVDEDGREFSVLDLAGGYGSLLLGHNNPEITAYATSLLEARTPVLTQFSRHSPANELAAELNRIIHRELGTDEAYYAIFANTGAEAVEAAVKHAEMDRVMRLGAIGEEIAAHIEQARAAVSGGSAVVAAGVDGSVGTGSAGRTDIADVADFDELVAALTRANAEQFSRPPVLLAPEGSFHGKLVGSVQLTHNEGYRAPFRALAAQARFVPLDQPETLRKTVDEERGILLDLVVENGVVRTVERPAPVFCAFVLEPIQGEGGIREVSRAYAEEIQRICAEIDCPVIVDEIQSGMGRTGSFLAGSQIGLRGDYYVLAKSMGGGLAKTSVMLVREARYRREFEMVHSSTFAKDGFSTLIALKVLELLEADGGRLYRRAAEVGGRLLAALESVRADFPDVVNDVRGRGLIAGLEFRDQGDAASEALREPARAGLFGYVLAGWLLQDHRIRTFPTASAVNTLRFEPSVQLTDADIDHVEGALREVCTRIRRQA
ncbi:aminotransferase class III-fold pyridoxal phosphate-dependent enzyme [Streptomyces sp. NPDC002133]|uniref:aspartate aminotransferase family protein n=1 Tax=Streptomyces sp. NPDC002133 TaxID=3154409 RepID=UPI00332A3DD8